MLKQKLTADEAAVLELTEVFVRETLEKDSSGHDWWHINRVRNNARRIAQGEADSNQFIVELGAMLHDIADWKFHDGDLKRGAVVTRDWLTKQEVDEETIARVCDIVEKVSFKGAKVPDSMTSLEGMIVQDADRLDAIGAMGIARAFAYGGHANRAMYDPNVPPAPHDSFEKYKNSKGHTINHFYEKLLLLKDRMNTQTGRALASERHEYMEKFLEQFFNEWEGRA